MAITPIQFFSENKDVSSTIFQFLPLSSFFQISLVCKRWKEIVEERIFPQLKLKAIFPCFVPTNCKQIFTKIFQSAQLKEDREKLNEIFKSSACLVQKTSMSISYIQEKTVHRHFSSLYQISKHLFGHSTDWNAVEIQLVQTDALEQKIQILREIFQKNLQIHSVRRLSLSHLQLETLPPEICLLCNLKVLNLANNKLENLPEEVQNLTNLECININNNQFHAIPKVFYSLKQLKTVDLRNNPIKLLPQVFEELNWIRFLISIKY